MKNFYLKPKLFSVMKDYSKEQLVKDIIAGIILPAVKIIMDAVETKIPKEEA